MTTCILIYNKEYINHENKPENYYYYDYSNSIHFFIFLFIKYEDELVFIRNLPVTIKKNISYKVDDYKISVPLHNFVFIKNIDVSLKPSVNYFTFLSLDEINKFYDKIKRNAEKNFKVYNYYGKLLYHDETNDIYIQIPEYYYIEGEKNIIKKVKFSLIDNNTIKKIIENGNKR